MGNEFRPGLPVARLFALAEQDLLPAETVPLSLPDFILSQLCNVPPSTDVTHAMAHGALDLQTLDWHSGALAALGLERLRWPKLLPQGGVLGFSVWEGTASRVMPRSVIISVLWRELCSGPMTCRLIFLPVHR